MAQSSDSASVYIAIIKRRGEGQNTPEQKHPMPTETDSKRERGKLVLESPPGPAAKGVGEDEGSGEILIS